MTIASVLPVSIDEAEAIARIVRGADREELDALGITDLPVGLKTCFGGSLKASKIVFGDEVLAVVGDALQDGHDGVGIPWLISTYHVEKHPLAFLRACKPIVADMLTRHRMLANCVHQDNKQAIRWLRWLGFTFATAIEHDGHVFIPFFMNSEV